MRSDLFRYDSDGYLMVGDVTVDAVLDVVGTPTLLIDLDRVAAAVVHIRASIGHRPLRLLYAVKALANVALLRRLAELDVGFDACSPGDLAFTHAAGVDPKAVSFLGHSLSGADLEIAVESGAFVTADSAAQVRSFGALMAQRGSGAPCSIGLRVNPGLAAAADASFHPTLVAGAGSSKFGIPLDDLPAAVRLAESLNLHVTSLHVHLGSDLLDPEAHVTALELLGRLAAGIPSVTRVNLGGGWGVAFDDDSSPFPWSEFGARADRVLPPELELAVEPGTYLVREAGYLAVSVTEVATRGRRLQVGTDGNTNALGGALLYGTEHPMAPSRRSPRGSTPVDATVVGNLMLGGDVLRQRVELSPPETGSRLVFGLAGAYCTSRASSFNQRPLAAEVVVSGGRATLARRRQSVESMLADQCCEHVR